VHRRCPAAPRNVEVHHEPGETRSLCVPSEGSDGKESLEGHLDFSQQQLSISPFSIAIIKCLNHAIYEE
jgi:hypothetical protein